MFAEEQKIKMEMGNSDNNFSSPRPQETQRDLSGEIKDFTNHLLNNFTAEEQNRVLESVRTELLEIYHQRASAIDKELQVVKDNISVLMREKR